MFLTARTSLLLAILFAFFACEKDEDPVISEWQRPECQPTQLAVGSHENVFEYDAEGRLIKSFDGSTIYIRYEYKDQRLSKLIYYFNDDETVIGDVDEIQYNAKGQWTKHVRAISEEEDIAEYDGNGNRVKITSKRSGTTYQSYTFDYLNGNLVKKAKTYHNDDGSPSFTLYYSYEYDLTKENKLTQFAEVVPRGYMAEWKLGQEPTPSKNRVAKVHTLASDGTTINLTANLTYELNDHDFPTRITVAGGDLNGDGVTNSDDVAEFAYQYDCL